MSLNGGCAAVRLRVMQPLVCFRILVRVVLLVVVMRGAQLQAAEGRTNAVPGVTNAVADPTNAAANALELSLKKLQLAPGLKVELWAAEPLVMNPVAISVDERGRVFVAETHRWGSSIFDITKELPWLLNDLSIRTVEQREEFLARQFATNSARLTNRSELIRLVEDRAGAGRADTSIVFAEGFNSAVSGVAAGILSRKGEVWFTCIPEVWRFRETNAAPLPALSPAAGARVPGERVSGIERT